MVIIDLSRMSDKKEGVMSKEHNIETGRVTGALIVILLHSFAYFIINAFQKGDIDTVIRGMIPATFTRVIVPVFVLISGKYIISNCKKMDYKRFYKKSLIRLLYPIVFWSIIYSVYKLKFIFSSVYLYEYMDGTGQISVSMGRLFEDFIRGVPYIHLWFLFMLLGLYFITPLLVITKLKLSKKGYIIFSIIFLLIAPFFEYFCGGYLKIHFLQLFTYIGLFTLGDILKDFRFKKTYKGLFIYFGVMSLAIILSILAGPKYGMLFSTSTIYTTTIGAVGLFLYFNSIQNKNNFYSGFGKYSLGIYCVHHLVLDILTYWTKGKIMGIMEIDVLLLTFSTFVISLIISMLIGKIKILKKVVI